MNPEGVRGASQGAIAHQSSDTHCFSTAASPQRHPWTGFLQPGTFLDTVVAALLSVFVFAMPTDFHPIAGVSLTLPVGTLCIALGLLSVAKRHATVQNAAGMWLLTAFVAWSTASCMWCRYPANAFPKVIKYWEFLPITWVITQYAWDRRIRMRLFDAYLVGCWLGAFGVIVNFATGHEFYIPGAEEAGLRYSFSTDPNYIALALVIGVPVALYRAARLGKRLMQVCVASYVPVSIISIGLTGSRGALLALLAGILALASFMTPWKRIILLACVAGCCILAFALPSSITWRLSTTAEEISYGTLDGRTTLWDQAPALIAEHPLAGMGAGAAEGVFDYAAHNTPLEILLEAGIIGLMLFYGAFAYSLYRTLKGRSEERRPLAIIAAIWAVGTLSISWDTHLITWFVLSMLFSVSSARRSVRCPEAPFVTAPAEPIMES